MMDEILPAVFGSMPSSTYDIAKQMMAMILATIPLVRHESFN
jgi:hypothetical protein